MKPDKALLGILAGIAAGTLVGVLIASNKGAKTRKKILRKSEEFAEELKYKFNDFLNEIAARYEGKRQEAEAMTSKGKTRITDVKM